VQFDELILQGPEDELRVHFHPELTVLSGLGMLERRALSDSILGALIGGAESTSLRYVGPAGRPITVIGRDGRVTARHADGSDAPPPLGTLAPDPVTLRSLMLLSADDLGVLTRPARDDEPPELREARTMLVELTEELHSALGQQHAGATLQAELDAVEDDLRAARDGLARREYAQVLAQLERVRAEAAAMQAGTASVDSDRHLLSSADAARALATRWNEASARVTELAAQLEGRPRFEPADRDLMAAVPSEPPADLDGLIDALQRSIEAYDTLDQRLQVLAVSKLPAPSDPVVAELGLLEQATLWRAAERLGEASATMQRVQLSLGGLEIDDMGPSLTLIDEIEAAHRKVEDADSAVAAAKLPGMVGVGVGVLAGVAGMAAAPVLLPVGLAGAAVAGVAGIVRPRSRLSKAARVEHEALEQADATTYLGFHIRRVEASVDPKLRGLVDSTMSEHRGALSAWLELVGEDIDVETAAHLRPEVELYNEALRNLGDTAVEIEQLRREIDEQAEPARTAARDALAISIEPYLIDERSLDDLAHLHACVEQQCVRGIAARSQAELDDAEVDDEKVSARLDDLLLQLGFDAGPLDARVGALEWAVSRALEREDARQRGRPRAELDAELLELQEAAANLRRPEWATVTAADAVTPDIPELEARRSELVSELMAAHAEVDVDRLADRHAAVERRVASLEARHGGHDINGDPGAIADMQQHLLAHLATASTAGPDGDPVPVVLDDVFLRVPADRKWDLLDLLHRLAELHQLVYLSDDAFVAAWARQRALDGTITLLELAPEPA
jgi:hypothetical protein